MLNATEKATPESSPALQRLTLITDAWAPQVNGVVRTYETLITELKKRGAETQVIHPGLFKTVPLPTYPEIRLAVMPGRALEKMISIQSPQAIHIATEGPLGWAARRHCLKNSIPFTTSFHTRFPDYVHARLGFGFNLAWRTIEKFHRPSQAVMVAAPQLLRELEGRGFKNCRLWTRGVDTALFHPGQHDAALFAGLPRPVSLYVGRVAVEKNIEDFLSLPLPGSKVIVGDGPQRPELERRFPQAVFVGIKTGGDLARHYASADVFIFPSRTDTFGMVMLEALACGTPVAAYPVPGPLDVITDPRAGSLDENLLKAAEKALTLNRAHCVRHAQTYSWARCADLFISNLQRF